MLKGLLESLPDSIVQGIVPLPTCRLAPMQKVAWTIKQHLWGILNAIVLGVHNGHAESTNSRIQRLKARACGFRNRERFRNAIYFHCGGLDLMPEGAEGKWLPT